MPDQSSLAPFTGERVAPDHPETAELYREHLTRYLFATQFCQDRAIVDAGCGFGYGAELLSRAGAGFVVGLDIAPEAIAYARQRYGSATVQFSVADCTKLPIEDQSAGLVVSFEVIEHLKNASTFLSEVRRILTPDGLALISTPNRLTYPPGNPFHFHEFDQTEFEEILQQFFPHVDICQQDVVGVNRIILPSREHAHSQEQRECITWDISTSEVASSFFIALCGLQPRHSPVQPVIVKTAGDLQQHCANLEEALKHQRQHNRDIEKEFDQERTRLREQTSELIRERDALRLHSTNLASDLNNLRLHIANLEDALTHMRKWNADLVTQQRVLTKQLEEFSAPRRDGGLQTEETDIS